MYRKIQIMATVFIMGTFQVSAQIGTGNGPLFIGINEADLTPQQAVRLNTVRYRLTTTETRIVRVSDAQDIEQLLYSKSVQLNLYEDLQFEASWERTEIWGENEFTWIGTPPDTVGHVILTVGEQGITGSIWAYGVTYSIVPLGQGAHVIYRVDQTKFIPEHPPGYGSGALEPRSEASSNGESAAEGEDDRSSLAKSTAVQSSHIYDVLVAYTGAAKNDAGGASAINNLISTVISKTNQIYGNSSTTPRAALVLKVEVNYTESGSMATDLARLHNQSDGYMDNVHTLRDQYGADIVVLITASGGGCGIAKTIKATAGTAFAVAKTSCLLDRYTFTHEIGHLFGSRHDIDPEALPYPYGHGFWNGGPTLETVLAKKLEGRFRIPYLSNPNIFVNGVWIGSLALMDNARVHDERATAVASFKSPPPPPLPPTNLYISGFQGGMPSINWTASTSPDVDHYELWWNEVVGPPYGWQLLATTSATSWVDSRVTIDSYSPEDEYGYKALTVDLIGLKSGFSNAAYVLVDECPPWLCKQLAGELEAIPEVYALGNNYPNPFNPSTTIQYGLPQASRVRLTIYDLMGKKVYAHSAVEEAGYWQMKWQGKNHSGQAVPSGVYIYRLVAISTANGSHFTATRKMLLLK